ncbi:hypothetical protein ACROYT_G039080 [Oculina patagonica]
MFAALAGLALAYVIDTAKLSQYAVQQFAEVENLLTSVERVMAYISLDSEPGYDITALPPINWPHTGHSRRCISVLSQSPVLFSGSLRKNLDPLEKHGDDQLCLSYLIKCSHVPTPNDELWNVLEEVKLSSLVESLEGKLEYELLERGENLSVGERQLICLARTLLQQSKIVISDEPTANVVQTQRESYGPVCTRN